MQRRAKRRVERLQGSQRRRIVGPPQVRWQGGVGVGGQGEDDGDEHNGAFVAYLLDERLFFKLFRPFNTLRNVFQF